MNLSVTGNVFFSFILKEQSSCFCTECFWTHGGLVFFLVLNRGTRLPVQSDLNRRWSAVSNALWGGYVTQHGGKATGVIYSSFSPLSFTLPLSTYLFCMFLPMFVSTKRRISVCLQEFRSQCFLFVPFVVEACVSWLNISKHEHSGTFIVFHICSHSRSHVSWSTYFWHRWILAQRHLQEQSSRRLVVSYHSSLHGYSLPSRLWRQSRLWHTRSRCLLLLL